MFTDDNYYELVKRKVSKDIDFSCNHYKDNYIKRRIEKRAIACKVSTFREYLRLLKSDENEYDMLLKELTVNVTKFFRNPEVFRLLGRKVIPDLINQKIDESRGRIKIWSAGCSGGEEPYSIAVLFHEVLKDDIDQFYVNIYATDIDIDSIEKAKKAVYPEKEFDDTPPASLRRHFTYDPKNKTYTVNPNIQDMVKFHNKDIIKGEESGNFDLIFCRNVTIYFSDEMKDKIHQMFYDNLRSGGYLIIGKTETLIGPIKEKFEVIDASERIYRKP